MHDNPPPDPIDEILSDDPGDYTDDERVQLRQGIEAFITEWAQRTRADNLLRPHKREVSDSAP